MKKWKVLLGTIALSLGLLFAVGSSKSVDAAAWHWGTPTSIRGHWKSKKEGAIRTYVKIGKNYYHAMANDPDIRNNTKYKYIGHHIYKVNGYEPIYSKKRSSIYIQYINRTHIKEWTAGTPHKFRMLLTRY
ncbi:hypothetical protein LASUN_10580 [Lentilactobacillus sunkii]|jgi:hypothetical protein|uniref:Uncharacterized protein n=1 Tax=Lentilactobacillus sunkii TaxID=481719 RepID=A0A1E7XEG4_9LACO|nr:hypothetical protein [Lentilactobacillus sunkii]OFA11449.1 hypothetical protein LASUN_10580 [Lentilactobacillus sunkii]